MFSRSCVRIVMSALLICVLLLLTVPVAAAPGVGGNGKGGGGGGGGGKSDDGKGGTYSDLVVAYRDVGGLPILTDAPNDCIQPVTDAVLPHPYEEASLTQVTNPVDGSTVTVIPLFATYPPPAPEAGMLAEPGEDEEFEPCDVLVIPELGIDYSIYVQEAELERLNLARTEIKVLDRKLREVALRLDGAEEITLDPAGRLTTDGSPIDAAPEQQAIRQALLEEATIQTSGVPPVLTPFRVEPLGPMELSAAALGGAAGKYVPITVDTVVYHDRILSIAYDVTATAGWSPLTHAVTGERFVDYGQFTYDRASTFPGCLDYVNLSDPNNPIPTYDQRYLDVVSFNDLGGPNFPKSNIAGYAQLADDARSVIVFTHDNVVIDADPLGVDTCPVD